MKRFKDQVLAAVRQHGMLKPGDRVIAAVSGGPDSVALASVLLELRKKLDINLTLAHLHHGQRPGEADEDMAFVRALAREWGVPLDTGRMRAAGMKRGGVSLEEALRERRYAFLERTLKTRKADKLAVGHNADDLVETFLINLLRGSVLSGLAGIPPVQGKVIRPLINCTREDILKYLKSRDIGFREDSSNLDRRFLRNRVRHDLIPELTRYNPAVSQTLLRTAGSFHELDSFLNTLARETFESIAIVEKGRVDISAKELADLPQALRLLVIREAIRAQKGDLRRIWRSHLESIDSLVTSARPNAVISLPSGVEAGRTYGRLVLERKSKTRPAKVRDPIPLKIPGVARVSIPGLGTATLSARPVELKAAKRNSSGREKTNQSLKELMESRPAFMDRDRLPDEIFVRGFKPGDRIQPFGMKGRRKVKDIFMEMKIPRDMRRVFPVLAADDEVIWIPGYRIAEPYKISPSTRRAVRISVRVKSPNAV